MPVAQLHEQNAEYNTAIPPYLFFIHWFEAVFDEKHLDVFHRKNDGLTNWTSGKQARDDPLVYERLKVDSWNMYSAFIAEARDISVDVLPENLPFCLWAVACFAKHLNAIIVDMTPCRVDLVFVVPEYDVNTKGGMEILLEYAKNPQSKCLKRDNKLLAFRSCIEVDERRLPAGWAAKKCAIVESQC
jgi:hypothetical protein